MENVLPAGISANQTGPRSSVLKQTFVTRPSCTVTLPTSWPSELSPRQAAWARTASSALTALGVRCGSLRPSILAIIASSTSAVSGMTSLRPSGLTSLGSSATTQSVARPGSTDVALADLKSCCSRTISLPLSTRVPAASSQGVFVLVRQQELGVVPVPAPERYQLGEGHAGLHGVRPVDGEAGMACRVVRQAQKARIDRPALAPFPIEVMRPTGTCRALDRPGAKLRKSLWRHGLGDVPDDCETVCSRATAKTFPVSPNWVAHQHGFGIEHDRRKLRPVAALARFGEILGRSVRMRVEIADRPLLRGLPKRVLRRAGVLRVFDAEARGTGFQRVERRSYSSAAAAPCRLAQTRSARTKCRMLMVPPGADAASFFFVAFCRLIA